MIFNVVLPTTLLANVAYKWLTAAGFGLELTSGISDAGDLFVFLIDCVPPAGAIEIYAYDVTDHSNVAKGNYAQVAALAAAAAVQSQTDKLSFTVPNQVDANIKSIDNSAITGDGHPGTEFGV
jgi:hypothetical protein